VPPALNRLVLQASIVERGPLRYTPAGLPALDLSLRYEDQVREDQSMRTIAVDVKSKAIGGITRQVQALSLGQTMVFEGFVAAGRNGRGMVFHITAIDAPNEATTATRSETTP
jgi:primosomal replication protein N